MVKYSSLKILNYVNRFYDLKSSSMHPPVHVRIKPINKCNHSCWYCSYRIKNVQIGKHINMNSVIPREKMFEIIDDLDRIGVEAVTFSGGGEPLLHPDIYDTLTRLVLTDMKFGIITNGSLLNGGLAKLIAKYGSWVRVSLDGWDSKSYAKERKVSIKEFDKVITNIANFKKSHCCIGGYIVVNKNNYNHIYQLSKILYKAGVNSIKIAPVMLYNKIEQTQKYLNKFYNCVQKQINRIRKDFRDIEVYDSYYNDIQGFDKSYNWCPYIQFNPVIGADLNVYACHDKAYNLEKGIIGSIKNKSFRDLWFSNKKRFLKINPSKDCKHHCMADKANKIITEFLEIDNKYQEFV